jgi:FixJ family two-component response regulator
MGRRLAQLEARLALMEGGRIGLVAATADAADDAEPAVARSGPDRLARRSDAAMRDQALAMLAAGASQRKVADALGVAQSTVAAWKKHHADPS